MMTVKEMLRGFPKPQMFHYRDTNGEWRVYLGYYSYEEWKKKLLERVKNDSESTRVHGC